jgi:hypothetical protein
MDGDRLTSFRPTADASGGRGLFSASPVGRSEEPKLTTGLHRDNVGVRVARTRVVSRWVAGAGAEVPRQPGSATSGRAVVHRHRERDADRKRRRCGAAESREKTFIDRKPTGQSGHGSNESHTVSSLCTAARHTDARSLAVPDPHGTMIRTPTQTIPEIPVKAIRRSPGWFGSATSRDWNQPSDSTTCRNECKLPPTSKENSISRAKPLFLHALCRRPRRSPAKLRFRSLRRAA